MVEGFGQPTAGVLRFLCSTGFATKVTAVQAGLVPQGVLLMNLN